MITNESITGFHFAAVKYDASSGNYRNSTYDKTMLRPYHEIPDDGPLPDPNASGSGSEENANHITWWPVMILQLHDDSVQVVREVTPGHVYVMIAFTRLSRTQFGPGQWKSWRRDFQSSAVNGKGCMHISVWTHLKCFLSNILCKICVRNYIHLGSRIMSDNKHIPC